VPTPDGFAVQKGATVVCRTDENHNYGNLKKNLIASGVLVAIPGSTDYFSLKEDYLFSSSSAAATVIAGVSLNGRISWKLPDGRTLKDWENEQIANNSGVLA
jgi:hypothetical protein